MSSLNEFTAIKVMGWIPHRNHWGYQNGEDWCSVCQCVNWNPSENIEQAMMMLDKCEQWGISRNLIDDGYYVSVVDWTEAKGDDEDWEAEGESLPLAITTVVARAYGWESNDELP